MAEQDPAQLERWLERASVASSASTSVAGWIDTESGTWRDCVNADEAGVWHADGIAAGKHVVYATIAAFSHAPDLVFEHELDAPDAAGIPYGRATVVAGARVRVVLTATSQSR